MNFNPCAWNDEAARKILPLVEKHLHNDFIADIRAGRRVLWLVKDQGIKTWLVTAIETMPNHVELVVECIAGNQSRRIMETLKTRVKPLGVKTIRFESLHPEKLVERMCKPLGFKRVATIFKCEL